MIRFGIYIAKPLTMFPKKSVRYLFVTFAVSAVFLWKGGVGAHTEGPMQLASVPAGPFKITVWSSPDPAVVGEIHIALAVTLAEDASPVLDADVQVTFKPENEGPSISAQATTENSENKFLYEAVTEIIESGYYEVVISLDAAEGTGEASFELEVESDSGINWYLIAAAVVIIVGLIYWGWRQRAASYDAGNS